MKGIKIFLSKKKKNRQYGHKRYKSLPEHENQRLVEHRKNIKYGKTKETSEIKTN